MTPPRHVVVIGAGFAGLACATALAGGGVRVTVLEARRQGGGRAGSFADPETGEVVDNGQHLLMACYRDTRAFLERIGTHDRVRFQPRLSLIWIEPGRSGRLTCPPLPAPLHLLAGMLAMKGLSMADRAAMLRLAGPLRRLRRDGAAALDGITVDAWLDAMGQTPALRRYLWHPLAIATLNESPDRAPAALLARVLIEGFLGSAGDAALGYPVVGLSDLYVEASRRFLESRGGTLRCGTPVASIEAGGGLQGRAEAGGAVGTDGTAGTRDGDGFESVGSGGRGSEGEPAGSVRHAGSGGRVGGVVTRDGEIIEADAVVCTVGPSEAARLGVPVKGAARFESSPILSVNLWFDAPVSTIAPFDFAGVIGRDVQWVFNKERIFGPGASHLAAVISAARTHVGRDNHDLAEMAAEDVRACLPAARGVRVRRALVVRERTATWAATVEAEPLRPGHATPWENLLLAGDWTMRGLPATIEAAARSGHECADRLMRARPS